jgi:hypothetical protein
MSYIARPTEVLKSYLEQVQGLKPRMEFTLGRLSMALEMITVIKTIEDELVPMLTLQRHEVISVLQTLLKDQDLAEPAMEWYEALTLWRQPVFVRPDAEHLLSDLADGLASLGGGLQAALVLAEGTRALHGDDQSPAPASGESDLIPDEAAGARLNESDEALGDSDESRAEFLRLSRSRRRTEP